MASMPAASLATQARCAACGQWIRTKSSWVVQFGLREAHALCPTCASDPDWPAVGAQCAARAPFT